MIRKYYHDISFIFTADDIRLCKKDDPRLNDCLKTLFESLRPRLMDGKSIQIIVTNVLSSRFTNTCI